MVLLNEGLAVLREDSWSFLCPRLWGDADTASGKAPLALSVDGLTSFVIGADDLYIAQDGLLTPQGRPELSSSAVIALAADGDALLGLRIASSGSALVRIEADDTRELFVSPEHWSALAAAAGRLHLARSTGAGTLAVATLDREGELLEEFLVPLPAIPTQLHLRSAHARLFAVTFDGNQYALTEVTAGSAKGLAASAGPIQGPQASGDQLWIAVDGELMRATDAGFEAAGEPQRITCLGEWGGEPYACAGSSIHRLSPNGLGERIFDLNGLRPPDPARVPEAAARECEFQWLLFRNDLVRSGLSVGEWPAVAMPEPGPQAGSGVGAPQAGAAGAAPAVADAGAERAPRGSADGGCSALAIGASPARLVVPIALVWPLVLAARRRRRRARAAPSRKVA